MRFTHLLLSVAVPLCSALVVPDEKVLSELGHIAVSEYQAADVEQNTQQIENEGTDVDAWWEMALKSGNSAAVDALLNSLDINQEDRHEGDEDGDEGNRHGHDHDDDGHDSDSDDEDEDHDDEDEDDDDDDDNPPRYPHPHPPHHRRPRPRPHKPCPPWELCPPAERTVWELLSESRHTTRLAEMISDDKKLRNHLNSSAANYTVFAPTNRALDQLPPRPEHGGHGKHARKFMREMLRYHVVPGRLTIEQMVHMQTLPTMLNESALGADLPQRLVLRMARDGLLLNRESTILAADIMGTNGIIHSIDTPLTPPPSTLTILDLVPDNFSTFALGLYKTGLASQLDPAHQHGRTTFVPTNGAFRRLGRRANAFLFSAAGEHCLRALLQYHLVVNHTLYSDVLYTAEGDVRELGAEGHKKEQRGEAMTAHVELPTLLQGRNLAVDVARNGERVRMRVNGFELVVGMDRLAKDGVLQVVDRVLVPPKKVVGEMPDETKDEAEVQELKERLAEWVNGKESGHAEL